METEKEFQWKETLMGGAHFVLQFLKNPISIMKQVPPIPIGEAIAVQGALASATGLMIGLMAKSIFTVIWGIILYPILVIVVCAITSLLLYYGSNYLSKKEIPYNQIYTLVFLASIPAYFIRILQPLLASIDLLGLAVASYLLRMGLIYSYKIDRKTASKIVLILYTVLLLGFMIQWLQVLSMEPDLWNYKFKNNKLGF